MPTSSALGLLRVARRWLPAGNRRPCGPSACTSGSGAPRAGCDRRDIAVGSLLLQGVMAYVVMACIVMAYVVIAVGWAHLPDWFVVNDKYAMITKMP